jgi:S1-C subfamily serine protease
VRPLRPSTFWLLTCFLLTGVRGFAQSDTSDRTWFIRDEKATQILGRPIRLESDNLIFQESEGQETTCKLDDLSEEDQREALAQVIGSGVVAVYPKSMTNDVLGMGSGFVIDKSGLIVTSRHVVDEAWEIRIAFRDTIDLYEAECLAADPENDVAIIRIPKIPRGTHILKLGGFKVPIVGDEVWAIGHPKAQLHIVTRGRVTSVFKTKQSPFAFEEFNVPARSQWIQVKNMTAPGSSGGPLLNQRGQVLGIHTFGNDDGVGLALHVLYAKDAYAKAQTAKPLELPLEPPSYRSAMSWLSRDVALIMRRWDTESRDDKLRDNKTSERDLERRKNYRQQLMTIVRREPKSWGAFQAGFLIATRFRDDTEDSRICTTKVCDMMLQHHHERHGMDEFVRELIKRHDDNTIRFTHFVLKEFRSAPGKKTIHGSGRQIASSSHRL